MLHLEERQIPLVRAGGSGVRKQGLRVVLARIEVLLEVDVVPFRQGEIPFVDGVVQDFAVHLFNQDLKVSELRIH